MALTRKSLKAMGLTDEQVDSIVEMHTETVDGLKDKLKTAEEKANQLDGVQKELNELKAKGGDDYKARAEKAEKALNDYKAEVAAKETKAAKESAVRAYFEGKSITGGNLNIAMRGAKDEINGLELDADGKIKDTSALDALVGGEYAALVVTTQTRGANTATPPAGNGGSKLTRADIYKKDDHGRYVMSTAERQKALAENPDLMK
jgi:hypothetical protein